MPGQTFLPGPTPDSVRTASGQTLPIPAGWELLPPGDAALTRRVKVAGEFWLVEESVAQQADYVEDIQTAVLAFLAFHERHGEPAAPGCPLARACPGLS